MGETRVIKSRRSRLRILIWSFLAIAAFVIITHNVIYNQSQSVPLALINLEKEPIFSFDLPDSNLCGGMRLNLKAAIAIDNHTQNVLYCYNADKIRSVASISKLLSAMVILDNYRPDSIMTITADDARASSRSIFRVGDRVTVRDLLRGALLISDNRAARAAARSVQEKTEDFAHLMNEKALALGLKNTVMFEPTGLDERNSSSAADVARLINLAAQYPALAQVTSLKTCQITITNKYNRVRKRDLANTNKLVFSKYRVLAGKTGYIMESDYCLATILEDNDGDQTTVVVLGAPGPQTRFREARRLASYAFNKIDQSKLTGL